MGNSLGGKKTAKIMKIDGQTLKLKTPVKAEAVVKDYPGHVLLESEAVKHFGIRAKPIEGHQNLEPKRLYFLLELPKETKDKAPRRVRSGINMSAKERLESLMLARRSVSDLSLIRPRSIVPEDESRGGLGSGAVRVRMRVPKAELEKLMKESKDEAEAVDKIVRLCMASGGDGGSEIGKNGREGALVQRQKHWNGGHGGVGEGVKGREKRVSFLPISEGEIQIAVAS